MEIVGYENYLIYEDGKVTSKRFPKRYLKESKATGGYLFVNLYKDGEPKKHRIHRLIAEHYIPNPDNKICVDHENGIKTDNRVENLRWATHSENGQNRAENKNNKIGIKNISYDKTYDRYVYKKMIRGELHLKYFKTLEEAIAYKNSYEQ